VLVESPPQIEFGCLSIAEADVNGQPSFTGVNWDLIVAVFGGFALSVYAAVQLYANGFSWIHLALLFAFPAGCSYFYFDLRKMEQEWMVGDH